MQRKPSHFGSYHHSSPVGHLAHELREHRRHRAARPAVSRDYRPPDSGLDGAGEWELVALAARADLALDHAAAEALRADA